MSAQVSEPMLSFDAGWRILRWPLGLSIAAHALFFGMNPLLRDDHPRIVPEPLRLVVVAPQRELPVALPQPLPVSAAEVSRLPVSVKRDPTPAPRTAASSLASAPLAKSMPEVAPALTSARALAPSAVLDTPAVPLAPTPAPTVAAEPPSPAAAFANATSTSASTPAPVAAPSAASIAPAITAPTAPPTATVAAVAAVVAPFVPATVPAGHNFNPKPDYPRAALRRGDEGTVLLRVRVAPDGRPLRASIERSSGFVLLDQSALTKVLAAWRFNPARRGNEPVEGDVSVPIKFEARGDE